VERGFFPLDEELELLPGSLTPSLVEQVVHLATWMPFAVAGAMVARFSRVSVPAATVRRRTEQAGAAYVTRQTEAVAALEQAPAESPSAVGPALQLLSVDGAMVSLVAREWAEVKTLVLGTVGEPVEKKGEWQVHTHDLSYFSRLADHETFGRLATVETQRRGTETAKRVAAVVDGADWEQGFIDLQRPDAVRILDWGHASEYVAKAGQAVFGAGTAAASEWLGVQLHELKHGEPQSVLTELGRLRDQETAPEGTPMSAAAREVVAGSLAYLAKRRAQIRYAEFVAQGYPIGSGAVESANKLVVEARLKGAGMHWAPEHVNPLVALRTVVCSDRWDEAWPQISDRLRQERRERAHQRRAFRHQVHRPAEPVAVVSVIPFLPPDCPQPPFFPAPTSSQPPNLVSTVPTASRRPAPDHPWRRYPVGRGKPSLPCSPASTEK
jgi:hypothetical protein